MAKNRFHYFSVENVEMLEIFNSCGPTVFFSEILLSLSIRVVKSKMEFAAAEVRSNMGVAHVTIFL